MVGVPWHFGLIIVRDGVHGLSELAGGVSGDAENKGVSCHNQLSIPGIPNGPVSESDGEWNVMLCPVELETGGRGCLKNTWGNGTVILCRMNLYLGSKRLRSVECISSSVT